MLTYRPESTSITAPDLLPLNNNDERFKQNQLINGKTRYEQENTIIKSLEEEIVNMKQKLSFVYEKDDEIAKLSDEIITLKKQLSETTTYSEEASKLRLENSRLNDDIQSLNTRLKEVSFENELNINELHKKIKTLDDTEESPKKVESERSVEIEDIDEMIDINVPHLRDVLTSRLKDKQMEHIESLIESYGLRRKNQVKKSLMEKMLEEAIHI